VTRVFLADRFVIPSDSMLPALETGNVVIAWKLGYGARIYRSLDFDSGQPDCFRLPAMGTVAPGDIVVFNTPVSPEHGDSVWFTINDVSCKRVLGTPGDRIGAVDGHVWNDAVLRPIGSVSMQEALRWTWDGIYDRADLQLAFGIEGWNIKNWGPLRVPQKGMEIRLDGCASQIYRKAIEWETGQSLNELTDGYVFQHDWFFMAGDNSPASLDSRFYGFVPDDFIIGKLVGR